MRDFPYVVFEKHQDSFVVRFEGIKTLHQKTFSNYDSSNQSMKDSILLCRAGRLDLHGRHAGRRRTKLGGGKEEFAEPTQTRRIE